MSRGKMKIEQRFVLEMTEKEAKALKTVLGSQINSELCELGLDYEDRSFLGELLAALNLDD